MEERIKTVLSHWSRLGHAENARHFGNGHINDTYLVELGEKQYILQKINISIFADPWGLMENICRVTEFIREKILKEQGDADREALRVILTDGGDTLVEHSDGSTWRLITYITDSVCLQSAQTKEDLFECAAAFGNFQKQLGDFPAEQLHETILQFHDTPKRYRDFEKALAEDKMGRAKEAAAEIEFMIQRKQDCSVMTNMQKKGELPLRVTHNDTKLNNVLFDKDSMKALCVIDLDTVMPGLAGNDFGDTVRFGANDCAEDEPDQSKVHFLPELYQMCAEGFLSQAGNSLTDQEIMTLPWGAKLMTLECGMRFLTDYLEGDHYFKISRPQQNLDRARTQFTLVRQMEDNWEELLSISKDFLDAKAQ